LPPSAAPPTAPSTAPSTTGTPLSVKTSKDIYKARAVLVAVGGMGLFNRLGVPGESPERVSYLFTEAEPFRGRQVLVVGGGNSAAEAALYLYEAGARVTILLRRPGFDSLPTSKGSSVKPWVRQPLEAAIGSGAIRALFSARVLAITAHSALVEADTERHEIDCDHIFALIGSRPDVSLLASAGAEIGEDGRPNYDPETYETTIPNLFVVGHMTRELHMKHAISVPPRIVALIAERLNQI